MTTRIRTALIAGAGRVTAFVAWISIVGCAQTENDGWAYTESDSAGVRVYDNHYSSRPIRWRFLADPREAVNIGTPDGSGPFFGLRGIALLDDNRMAVAEETRVQIMTLTGSDVVSVGRDGEGPGEFRDIAGIVRLPGDSVLVLDGDLMRLSTFDAAGALGHMTRLETDGGERLWRLYAADDRTVVVGTAMSGRLLGADRSTGRRRLPYRAFRYERTGRLLDVVGPLPGTEVVVGESGGLLSMGIAPFAHQTTIGVAGQHLYLGTAEQFEILVTRLDATPVAIMRLGPLDLALDEREVEAWIDNYAAQLRSPVAQGAFLRAMAQAEPPTKRPAFEALVVSDAGDLWIKEFDGDSDRDVLWHIVAGADGRYCGSLSLPGAFWLMDVRSGRLAGMWKDEMELEYVRLYELDGTLLEACNNEVVSRGPPVRP